MEINIDTLSWSETVHEKSFSSLKDIGSSRNYKQILRVSAMISRTIRLSCQPGNDMRHYRYWELSQLSAAFLAAQIFIFSVSDESGLVSLETLLPAMTWVRRAREGGGGRPTCVPRTASPPAWPPPGRGSRAGVGGGDSPSPSTTAGTAATSLISQLEVQDELSHSDVAFPTTFLP